MILESNLPSPFPLPPANTVRRQTENISAGGRGAYRSMHALTLRIELAIEEIMLQTPTRASRPQELIYD